MKNQKLSRAIEHDLKVAIRDGQREIKEGFRTGKEPNWKAIEADMKSQLDLNPNTYQKHVDHADKRHISHCKRASVNPKVDSHNYDKYESFYKKNTGKYVVKNNIDRMKSLWKKTKGKTSSERVSYYQKVKGVWDRRNRRSSKFITSRITENASRENNAKTTGFVDLLNLGPKPCLECIALRGLHNAETAPELPIHDHCYCEYRPVAKKEKKVTAPKPTKLTPIAIPEKKVSIPKDEVRKGLEGQTFKINSNKPLNKQEDETIRALQLRMSPKYRQRETLMRDFRDDKVITFMKDDSEAFGLLGRQWSDTTAGITIWRKGSLPKIFVMNKYRKVNTIHEIGHMVDYRMNPEVRSAVKDCWRAKVDVKKTSKISAYSLTDEEEYFAESFQAYVRQPTKLMKVDKKMYNIIKNDVFDGFEWT